MTIIDEIGPCRATLVKVELKLGFEITFPLYSVDALNEDPVNVDSKDVKGSQEDPMIVDEYPTVPNEDVPAKVGDAGKQLRDATRMAGDPKEALVRWEGVARKE